MVPYNSRETKYLFSDGSDPHIGITIWWAPKTSQSAACRIIYHLKSPPKLSDHVSIGQCSHMWMGPGVYGDVIRILKGEIEFLPIIDDIDSDKEVRRSDLVLLQECIQAIGRLKVAPARARVRSPSRLAPSPNSLEVGHRRRRFQSPRGAHPRFGPGCDTHTLQSTLGGRWG